MVGAFRQARTQAGARMGTENVTGRRPGWLDGSAGAGRACAWPWVCVCVWEPNRGESASGGVDSVRVAVFIGETKTENPTQTAERWLCVRGECMRACMFACGENKQLSPTVCLCTHMHKELWLEGGSALKKRDIYLLFWVFRDIGEAFVFFLEKSLV